MTSTGAHVSPAVYRARRRLVAALTVTVLVLTATAVHRLTAAGGAAEVAVADQLPAASVPGPRSAAVVASPSAVPTGTARSTATPVATAVRSSSTDPVATVRPGGGPTRRPDDQVLPPSGTGRRVVYSIGHQRVWLVSSDGRVVRSYRVSGAREEYVEPGTFHVYSASEKAVAWDHESTMRWMVRFAKGPQTSIGFHEIPVEDETHERAQEPDELGAPLSDGCIRQDTADARAMFAFAPVGTRVVVTT